MIKPILPAIALIGASLLLPTAARANDYLGIDHYCYMVESSGRVVNLSAMCQNTRAASIEDSLDLGEYIEGYEAIASTGNYKFDPVADGIEYCEQAASLDRAQLGDWFTEQWNPGGMDSRDTVIGLPALESDYLLSHWSTISVLAPDLLCPQL